MFRRTPKGANVPDWIAESVCFYGAALCAATPACVVKGGSPLSFRFVRSTVGVSLIFNGGRYKGGVYLAKVRLFV